MSTVRSLMRLQKRNMNVKSFKNFTDNVHNIISEDLRNRYFYQSLE
ncbi:hypothetical protein [Vulcanisaeta sp. JCM 14467]|nr:hypothetical protein [Vulcanisaeta sp. JCM 14467]